MNVEFDADGRASIDGLQGMSPIKKKIAKGVKKAISKKEQVDNFMDQNEGDTPGHYEISLDDNGDDESPTQDNIDEHNGSNSLDDSAFNSTSSASVVKTI